MNFLSRPGIRAEHRDHAPDTRNNATRFKTSDHFQLVVDSHHGVSALMHGIAETPGLVNAQEGG